MVVLSCLSFKVISKPLLRSPEVRVCTVGKMEKFMLGTQMQKNLRVKGSLSPNIGCPF